MMSWTKTFVKIVLTLTPTSSFLPLQCLTAKHRAGGQSQQHTFKKRLATHRRS